jgi:ABC-2 type transport system permease protein
LENGEKVVLDIQVDGTEPLSLKTLTEKMTEIVAEQNRENASEALSELNIEFETQAIEVEKEILYNPDLRDRDFFVPGVIGIVVATIPMLLSCLAIVKEREMGTIEAIMAAPISRPVFILGKLVPYALIGLIGLGITSALGVFWFKIPFRGDMLLYIGASFVFILSSLGLGLLFSVFVRDSVQAIFLVVTFLVISILLSGFVFPVSGMPEVIQQIMRLFPLTYFMTIVRGILIKGVGFAVLKPDLIALTAISLATSVLSSFGLSKKLD